MGLLTRRVTIGNKLTLLQILFKLPSLSNRNN